jgi:DNA-binding response OmpR family regulator
MNAGYRILIFEPNSLPDQIVLAGLASAGYVANWCVDSDQATQWMDRTVIDLAIIGLATDPSGLTLIDRLVSSSRKIPVLITTAVDAMENRVQGLQRGAIDYLVKPYAVSEMLIRIGTALHRRQLEHGHIIQRNGILLDKGATRFGDGSDWTSLTPTEFQAFHALFDRMNDPVSKQSLRQYLADGERISDNAIEVLIHRLRAKTGRHEMRIRTHRGAGYVLERSPATTHIQKI